ncbi:MAG: DUF2892 domain-containing protein [Thermodesulfobacteriota bacterium]
MLRDSFPCNVGTLERAARFVAGFFLLFVFPGDAAAGSSGFILSFLGGLGVLSGAVGYCPIYAFLKIDTSGKKEEGGRGREGPSKG